MQAWPFIARADEVAALHRLLADPRPRAAVVAGPPGSGKTRLLREAVRELSDDDWSIVRVGGVRAAAEFPLVGLAAALPATARSGGTDVAALLARAGAELRRIAGARRLLLVVDDAQHLDEVSAMLVHHLVLAGDIRLLATIGPGPRIPDSISALWKDGLAERIDLEPFTVADTARLLGAVLDGPVSHSTAAALTELSRGNALYLHELISIGVGTGAFERRADVWVLTGTLPVTDRLSALVELRLDGLTPSDRALLELIALSGPIELDLIRPAAPADADPATLDDHGLLSTPTADARLVVGVAHPLFTEVLLDRMSPLRRRAALSALIETFERHRRRGPDDLLRLASWQLELDPGPDPDLLAAAARVAYTRHDYALARRYSDAALARTGRFETRLLGALAASRAGDGAAAARLLASIDLDDLSSDQRFEVRLAQYENLFYVENRPLDATPHLVQALEDPTPSAARDQLTLYLHQTGFVLGDPKAPAAIAAIAERATGAGRGAALGVHSVVLLHAGQYTAAATAAGAARTELERSDHPTTWPVLAADEPRTLALAELGRLDEATALVREAFQQCRVGGWTDVQALLACAASTTALLRGDVADAVGWAGEAAALRPPDVGSYFAARAQLALTVAAAHAGDVDTATAAGELAAGMGPPGPWWKAQVDEARAWVTAGRGDVELACEQLAAAAARAAELGYHRTALAGRHGIRRLGRTVLVTASAPPDGSVDGPLASARRDHLAATSGAALLAVAERFEALGTLLFAAEAAAEAAAAFAGEGRPREVAAATRTATRLAALCSGARLPSLLPPAVRAALTPRERTVAELASRGLSSRQIADELVLAVRTVENTLHRAYTKLGLRGRHELAAALAQP